MTGRKPIKPRQRAFFLLGLRHAQRRHRAELREMEERLDEVLDEVGSAAERDDDIERPDDD